MSQGLFLIRSPFQMLCAVEAKLAFNIKDYTLYIITDKNPRVNQIVNICHKFQMDFEFMVFSQASKNSYKHLLKQALTKENLTYDYIFIGDFREQDETLYALPWANNRSKIIYLDDGNVTVNLLLNELVRPYKFRIKEFMLKMLFALKRIERPYYYTIYDIPNSKYKIIPCALRHINSEKSATSKKNIYFIGTNSIGYINYYSITEQSYLKKLNDILGTFRKENKEDYSECIFIPHGAEKMSGIEDVVIQNGFKYHPINECAELYFANLEFEPIAVAGLGSSALYTAKVIFPETKVINYYFKGDNNSAAEEQIAINKFYKQSGIEYIIYE